MAPSKFQIYVDQSMTAIGQQQPRQRELLPNNPIVANQKLAQPSRFIHETLPPNQRFYFDERKLYPTSGDEYSFEEINLNSWRRRQKQLADNARMVELQRENDDLRQKVDTLNQKIAQLLLQQKQQHDQAHIPAKSQVSDPEPALDDPIKNRLSIVPQSLQPTQGLEYADMTYQAINDASSIVRECWRDTLAHDKFTVPIDQSQYIKEHAQTSTPQANRQGTANMADNDKRAQFNGRRMSRPSMGGSPTLKLTPITETSRDCNSKSSSSSSATSGTPGTAKKIQLPLLEQPAVIDEPDEPLNPNDPSTYRCLLRGLVESLDRRSGYFKLNRSIPKIRRGACFQAGSDNYLVDSELSQEPKIFTAQLLNDDSNDSDVLAKTVCLRVDQPANDWLFYICNELHRRLVKQKTRPDIELSVMIANPAVMYTDGSILVDEYFRFVSLQHLTEACKELNKPFPKPVAAYITLELIQLVRQIHTCDIVHMNIDPKNVLIICCPTRDDIAKVNERTSIVKLIGFERAMDLRLIRQRIDQAEGDMIEPQPWNYEVDWVGALNCIFRMFFLEDLEVSQDDEGRRYVEEHKFDGFPTNVWSRMFKDLLNVGNDMTLASSIIEHSTDELNTWIKANINFVLKEADSLDRTLEEYCKATNKTASILT